MKLVALKSSGDTSEQQQHGQEMQVEINFVYNWEDLRSSAHYLSAPGLPPWKRRLRPLWTLFAFGTFAFVVVGLFCRWPDRYLGPPALFGLILILRGKLHGLRMAAVRSGWIGGGPRMNVVLDDNGIAITKRQRTTLRLWSVIEGAIFAEAGIFLRQQGGGGYLLPRRAFVESSSYDEVAFWIDSKVNSALVPDGALPASDPPSVGTIAHPPAPASVSYNDVVGLERRGMFALAVGWLGGMLLGGMMAMMVSRSHDWIGVIPIALGHLYQAWGCGMFAKARGFRTVHGVLAGLVPLFGAIFIATRARPEPGERIDRQSLRGFLFAPFARQSDISSWAD